MERAARIDTFVHTSEYYYSLLKYICRINFMNRVLYARDTEVGVWVRVYYNNSGEKQPNILVRKLSAAT